MIKTVLFDLDGTLLPMDQDQFTRAYFEGLTKKLAPLGYEPMSLTAAVWAGTMAMIKNKGQDTNENLFWQVFNEKYGVDGKKDEATFADFYRNEFHQVKSICGFQPKSAELIAFLRGKGVRVILATNPIFPRVAVDARLAWAGLHTEDFAWITSYENSHYCKPNPAYYKEILEQFDADPIECLMVGNDVSDDMPAANLGMSVFLLTDCLINKGNADLNSLPHGSMDELMDYVRASIE